MNHYHLEDFNEQCYMCQRDRAEKSEARAAETRANCQALLNHFDHLRGSKVQSDCGCFICKTLKRIIGNNQGVGWLSPDKVKELNDEIGNLRERATHAEQAALEMAEKVKELKAENRLFREALDRVPHWLDCNAARIGGKVPDPSQCPGCQAQETINHR